MDERELSQLVKARAGLRTVGEARRAIAAALAALGGALDEDDARALASGVPAGFARSLARPVAHSVRGADDLYVEAERRESVGPGFAREHVQSVFRVLAGELDPELLVRLRKHLPSDVAALLTVPPPPPPAPPYVHAHPPRDEEPIQTLSRARPGTAEPIADASHPLAHERSVARSPSPHADRMVETARSTRPGREDETIATTRGDNKRR